MMDYEIPTPPPVISVSAEEIERAKQEAYHEAFQHVKKRLNSTTALESLSQFKQVANQRYQNKQAFLKARVQKGVSDIETGIENLNSTAESMHELLTAIQLIEDECSAVSTSIPEFDALTKISILYDNLVTIKDLVEKLDLADQMIDSINDFLKDEPFSVHCYNYLQYLKTFEADLKQHVHSPELLDFIKMRFSSVHTNLSNIVASVTTTMENIFSEEEIDSSLVTRAIWILYAEGKKPGDIDAMLQMAIFNNLNHVLQGTSEQDIASKLDILSNQLLMLPDQLEAIMPALPTEIDAVKLINDKVNNNLYAVLSQLWNDNSTSSYYAKNLLVWLKSTTRSMRRTIGIGPSQELDDLASAIENDFTVLMSKEFMKLSANILARDYQDVEETIDGTLVTPAPADLMRSLIDGYTLASQINLESIMPKVAQSLVSGLVTRLREYADNVSYSDDIRYVSAVINNCMDGVQATRDCNRSRKSLMTDALFDEVKPIWSQIQSSAMARMQILVRQHVLQGSTNLRDDYPQKMTNLCNLLDDLQKWLRGPLYMKLEMNQIRQTIPQYMMTYQENLSTDPKDSEQFRQMMMGDKEQILGFIQPRVSDTDFDMYDKRINDFIDLMTQDQSSTFFSFASLNQAYPDFSPTFACRLMAHRASKVPNMLEDFEKTTLNASKDAQITYFDSMNVQEEAAMSGSISKGIKKLLKKDKVSTN